MDPGVKVDPALLQHLHLILEYQYPRLANPHLEQIVQYLRQAPLLVKEARPVSWKLIAPPNAGDMFLEYLPQQRETRFPSDGFVWLDPERYMERDLQDHVLDILSVHVGFVPQRDQVASHARFRYRIRRKDGQPSPFDPQLWLVHYKPTEQNMRVPVANLPPLSPQILQMLHERQMLLQQGFQQMKEFVLLDRNAWPTIHWPTLARRGPGAAPPGYPPPHMRMGQPPGMYSQSQYTAGPPAKRPRQVGPVQVMGPSRALPVLHHDLELEDAEDTAAGDLLDYLTPAGISVMRFQKHHSWLEEIFSSLHSMSQILPEDLGFGLTGELGELTKDILNPPDPSLREKSGEQRKTRLTLKPNAAINEKLVYRHLEPEKYAEFEKRVADFVERKNREMDDMREHHAKIMADVNKGKYYLEAEDKLREAGLDAAKIDEVVHDVELKMGVALHERGSVVCVQRDEFEVADEEEAKQQQDLMDGKSVESTVEGNGIVDDGTAGLLDEFTSTNEFAGADAAAVENDTGDGDMELMDGMDLDIDIAKSANAGSEKKDDDWVVVDSTEGTETSAPSQPQTSTVEFSTAISAAAPAAPAVSVSVPERADLGTIAAEPPAALPVEPAAAVSLSLDSGVPSGSGELVESMFDDGDFSAFDGLEAPYDASAAEGLLDFDNASGNAPSGDIIGGSGENEPSASG